MARPNPEHDDALDASFFMGLKRPLPCCQASSSDDVPPQATLPLDVLIAILAAADPLDWPAAAQCSRALRAAADHAAMLRTAPHGRALALDCGLRPAPWTVAMQANLLRPGAGRGGAWVSPADRGGMVLAQGGSAATSRRVSPPRKQFARHASARRC